MKTFLGIVIFFIVNTQLFAQGKEEKILISIQPTLQDTVFSVNNKKVKILVRSYSSNDKNDHIKKIFIVKKEKKEEYYLNTYIDLSIIAEDKTILKKTIGKDDFISITTKQFLNKSIIYSFGFDSITKYGFKFLCSLCVPDTDECADMDIFVDYNGKLSCSFSDEE